MKKILLIAAASLTLSLQACVVAGAAVGATAVAIAYDHRNVDSILLDQKIDRRIYQKIQDDQELADKTHISVTSFGQVVLLTGEAPNAELRKRVENLAKTTRYVKKVYNAISVQKPTSHFTHASDSWITTKIKTEILATKGLKASSIKVVTENDIVYLMGVVSHQQEALILDIVKHVSGVRKVVKIFQYDESLSVEAAPATSPDVVDGSENSAADSAPANESSDASSSVKTQGADDMDPLIPS